MLTDGSSLASIASIARRFRKGELSPVELLEDCIERYGRLNEQLNALVTVDFAAARKEAEAAERRIREGSDRGPLDGIPIALKDIFFYRGMRTTGGSKVFADFVADVDATAAARLKDAGAIIVGMANTHEFARGTTTTNILFGQTRNPWDLERVPGGSSGGSAAAVAASLVVAATGTDTGGSIRVPAGLCGIVGIKPTYGRVSRYGIMPAGWSLDHAGPMTRTVADAALLLQVMAGADPLDPSSSTEPVPDYTAALDGNIQGVKIGVPSRYFFESLEPDVEESVKGAINRLEELGAHLVTIDWPGEQVAEQIVSVLYPIIVSAEGAAWHEPYLQGQPTGYSKATYERLEPGRVILATEYINAQRLRATLNRRLDEVFNTVDFIVAPTTPTTAPPIETAGANIGGAGDLSRGALSRLTRLANFTGWPAISVPCGLDRRSLPIGFQIMGRPFDEAGVLKVAHAYEMARGPFPVPPVVSRPGQ